MTSKIGPIYHENRRFVRPLGSSHTSCVSGTDSDPRSTPLIRRTKHILLCRIKLLIAAYFIKVDSHGSSDFPNTWYQQESNRDPSHPELQATLSRCRDMHGCPRRY